MTIHEFPYKLSRRAFARRPRRSKNGTPEERAAKKAAAAEVVRLTTGTAAPDQDGNAILKECEALADLLRLADRIEVQS